MNIPALHAEYLGVILFNSNQNCLSNLRQTDRRMDGRNDRRTDNDEFNSPASSLGEAGDKKKLHKEN